MVGQTSGFICFPLLDRDPRRRGHCRSSDRDGLTFRQFDRYQLSHWPPNMFFGKNTNCRCLLQFFLLYVAYRSIRFFISQSPIIHQPTMISKIIVKILHTITGILRYVTACSNPTICDLTGSPAVATKSSNPCFDKNRCLFRIRTEFTPSSPT